MSNEKKEPALRFKDEDGKKFPAWEIKSLGELAHIKTGKKDLVDKVEDGQYPFYVRSENIESIDTYSYDGEAILIPGDGRIGEIYHYANGKFDYHQRVYKISEGKGILIKYLYNYLSAFFKKHALGFSVKATVDSLRLPIIQSFKVKLPSLEEQQKIASFLTAIDDKIENLEQQLEALKAFKKGVMQGLFSEDGEHMGGGGNLIFSFRFRDENGMDFPAWTTHEFGLIAGRRKNTIALDTDNDMCIELESLSQGTGQLLTTFSAAGQLSVKNQFQKGDVLFGKLRPYLRKYYRPDFEGVCSSEIWVLNGKKASNQFLYFLVQTDAFINIVNSTTGSKMPRADWKLLEKAHFSIPGFPEQQKIADCLSAVESRINLSQEQITQIQLYKKSLLQQLFN